MPFISIQNDTKVFTEVPENDLLLQLQDPYIYLKYDKR